MLRCTKYFAMQAKYKRIHFCYDFLTYLSPSSKLTSFGTLQKSWGLQFWNVRINLQFLVFFQVSFCKCHLRQPKPTSQAFHHLYLVRLNKVGWLSVWCGGRLIERLQTKDRIADFNIYSFYLNHCTFMFFLLLKFNLLQRSIFFSIVGLNHWNRVIYGMRSLW